MTLRQAEESRTIYAFVFRGKPANPGVRHSRLEEIDENALKPVEKPEQHAGEELKAAKVQLGAAEEERDRAINELRQMKMVAQEANMKQNDELSSSRMELKMRDKSIDLLKTELKRAKEFEVQLAERDVTFDILRDELMKSKASEAQTVKSLMDCKMRIDELEDEVERAKMSETKMSDTISSQKKELDERRLEVASLREKIEVLTRQSCENVDLMKDEIARLMSELEMVKEDKKIALSKTGNLVPEMKSLQSELRLALEAEEKSKKAMDDLALALKEVATEANITKEKLLTTEAELEQTRLEAERLKSNEERYKKLLDEAAIENERHKNTIERLNIEAEESLLAWTDKEKGFVSCIKRAEEERDIALSEASNETKTSKEENVKLRDIMKQALNEANVAKEAAGIAREENSQLKDTLAEKNETIEFLVRENESLRMNEAAALESINELKRLLATMESEKDAKTPKNPKTPKSSKVVEDCEDETKMPSHFGFNLNELRISNLRADEDEKDTDYDSFRANPLKGSIFDNVDTPKSEPHTPAHRRVPSTFRIDGETETTNSADMDNVDPAHFSDAENDRNLQRRRKALIWKFGDLIKRKSYYHHHRKDSSGDQKKEAPPVEPKKESAVE